MCDGHGAGQRSGVENEEKLFQCLSSCSAQVCVMPTKSLQKPFEFTTGFSVCRGLRLHENKMHFSAFGMKKMAIWKDFHVITADSTYLHVTQHEKHESSEFDYDLSAFECKHETFV